MGERLDWRRLVDRCGASWCVLPSGIVLHGFVCPDERTCVPAHIVEDRVRRLAAELGANAPVGQVCDGPIPSREQYLIDIDARK